MNEREQAVIDILVRRAPAHQVPIGPGDDAAVLPGGQVVTVDALVEGVHWDDALSAADVGFKAVAVSVSDLAAMGARPEWMVLALCLPQPLELPWVEGFADGLAEAARMFSPSLIGGDVTASTTGRVVSVTMGGRCVADPLTRDGGRAGDRIWVTGTPGLASAGYRLDTPPAEALAALRRPRPPLSFALELAQRGLASAAMDLSDGLAADLPRILQRSSCGAILEVARLPLAAPLEHLPDPHAFVLAGGDDYELLFTASPAHDQAITELARDQGVQVAIIGELTQKTGIALVGGEWPTDAWTHFGQ